MTNDPLAAAADLLRRGQAEEARRLLQRLHRAEPGHVGVLLQLALAERQLKRWPQAIARLNEARALAPQDLRITEQLAMALLYSNDGRNVPPAIGRFAELLAGQPDFYAMGANLLVLALRNDMPQPVLESIAPLLERDTPGDGARLHYASACAIASFLIDDATACAAFVEAALSVRTAASAAEGRQPGDLPFMLLYVEFLHALLAVRTAHPERYRAGENAPRLHVIGESHCLTPAHMSLRPGRCVPHLLMGAMAYFFTLEKPNAWQYALQETIRRLPKDEPLIVGFGELDCRATGGIMAQHRSRPDYVIAEAVDELGTKYVQFVKRAQLHRQAPACIAGVPAPNRAVGRDLPPGEAGSFTGMIRDFNAALAREAAQQQLGFIDLYAGTVDHDGWAKDGVHIDHVHLKPSVTAGAIEAAFARRSFAC